MKRELMMPPMVNEEVLDYWRYMNKCNPDGTRTPLSRADVTRLFAYIELLEERITEGHGNGTITDLKECLGLGAGYDGTGVPSRAEVRKELRTLDRRRNRRKAEEQHTAWLGKLPLYTARFEMSDTWVVASIDEMPGVLGQGRTLASCMTRLAHCVRGAVDFEKKHGHERFKRGAWKKKLRSRRTKSFRRASRR